MLGLLLVFFAAIPLILYTKTTTITYRLEDVTQMLYARNSCVGAIQGTRSYDALIHVIEHNQLNDSILLMTSTVVVEHLNVGYPTFIG